MRLARRRTVAACAAFVCVMAGSTALAVGATTGGFPTAARPAVNYANALVARYAAKLPARLRARATSVGTSVDQDCFSAADNHVAPDVEGGVPTNPAWILRDALNVYCSTLRLRDQAASGAFAYETVTNGSALYLDQLGQQITDGLGHIHGGLTTLVPGSQAADPFRTISEWEQLTGGTVNPVSFTSLDGAVLRGNIFMPPPGTPKLSDGKYPGVVITDGSVQAYQQLYYWAAEGLAQYGYEVMTYDVQGQGDSDLLPSNCPDLSAANICIGVPYQQNYNFYQGAEDSLNFFLSTPTKPYGGSFNPDFASVDAQDVAIAGHSLGASAVSWVGQCDRRVKAIVAWDDLLPVTLSQCAKNVTIPKPDRAAVVHAPSLAMTNDYEFNPQPAGTVPDPNGGANSGGLAGTSGYLSLAAHHVDSEIVSIRNGTHLTYSYIPLVLPANEIGERVAFYYTLAWLDEYLRGGKDPLLPASDTAFKRLTSLGKFDRSADYNDNKLDPGAADIAIGTGGFDALKFSPSDPTASNVPYEIEGIPIRNTLSFYYYSEFSIHNPRNRALLRCSDMLSGCPAKQPSTP
jgi:hypothetical protein